MGQQVNLYYGPDLDQAWSRNAGVCKYMTQLLPTIRGTYTTVATTGNYFDAATLTSMPLIGYLFRQVNGTERLIMFNTTTIDEYSSLGVPSSLGTGYSASTAGWSAAAFGNNIIACNYLDATQVSAGTTFGALGGSPPKARHVTVQSNFVMFADTDDGTNQFADQVWWSGLGNSASYTPDLATQAGNIRLVGSPGPIRCLVNFRDYVVAFKDDATYLGQYVGPPSIWSWRLASNRIGCIAQHGAAEMGGVLYFIHTSGIYSFDGSQFANVGRPVMQTLLKNCGVLQNGDLPQIVSGTGFTGNPRLTQVVTDDVDNIVLFAPLCMAGSQAVRSVQYGYNTQSRKWGTIVSMTTASQATAGDQVAFVKCTNADILTFKTILPLSPRFLYAGKVGSSITCNAITYPAQATPISASLGSARIMTGIMGSTDQSMRSTRLQFRFARESVGGADATIVGATVAPYTTEGRGNALTTISGALNDTFQAVDFNNSSRFCTVDTIFDIAAFEVTGAEISKAQRP